MLENFKILVVDDEPLICQALKRLLSEKFACVDLETIPLNALNKIKNNEYAVIISDQRMPELQGVDFLEKCVFESPDSVRILLTGARDSKTSMEAITKSNISKYINKPWDDAYLVKIVESACQEFSFNKLKGVLNQHYKDRIRSVKSKRFLSDGSVPFVPGEITLTKEEFSLIEAVLGSDSLKQLIYFTGIKEHAFWVVFESVYLKLNIHNKVQLKHVSKYI